MNADRNGKRPTTGKGWEVHPVPGLTGQAVLSYDGIPVLTVDRHPGLGTTGTTSQIRANGVNVRPPLREDGYAGPTRTEVVVADLGPVFDREPTAADVVDRLAQINTDVRERAL